MSKTEYFLKNELNYLSISKIVELVCFGNWVFHETEMVMNFFVYRK